MHIPATITEKNVETNALLDSGAGGIFMDKNYIKQHHITMELLPKPIKVYNVDGTQNKTGSITWYTWQNMVIGGHTLKTRFLVSGLGKEDVILGLPWLCQVNPKIDWHKNTLEIIPLQIKPNLADIVQQAQERKGQVVIELLLLAQKPHG